MKKVVIMCIIMGVLYYCVASQGADTARQEVVAQPNIPITATFDFSLDYVMAYRGDTNDLRSMQISGQCELTSKKSTTTQGSTEIVVTLRNVKVYVNHDGKTCTNDDLKKEIPNYEGMELRSVLDEKGVMHGPSLDKEKAVAPELFKAIFCKLPREAVTGGKCWVVENAKAENLAKINPLEYGATTNPAVGLPGQSKDSQTEETVVTITTVEDDGSCVATTHLNASGEVMSAEINRVRTIRMKGSTGAGCTVFKLKKR